MSEASGRGGAGRYFAPFVALMPRRLSGLISERVLRGSGGVRRRFLLMPALFVGVYFQRPLPSEEALIYDASNGYALYHRFDSGSR